MIIGTDCIGICKSDSHTSTTTTAPFKIVLLLHWNGIIGINNISIVTDTCHIYLLLDSCYTYISHYEIKKLWIIVGFTIANIRLPGPASHFAIVKPMFHVGKTSIQYTIHYSYSRTTLPLDFIRSTGILVCFIQLFLWNNLCKYINVLERKCCIKRWGWYIYMSPMFLYSNQYLVYSFYYALVLKTNYNQELQFHDTDSCDISCLIRNF